jgi:hypothetical protein
MRSLPPQQHIAQPEVPMSGRNVGLVPPNWPRHPFLQGGLDIQPNEDIRLAGGSMLPVQQEDGAGKVVQLPGRP